MASKRMFDKSVVLADKFMDMSVSARYLYFNLGMNADDDGFIGNIKSIIRQCEASIEDLNELLANGYILSFFNGIYVITDWLINNQIRTDRHKDTTYRKELEVLEIDETKRYVINDNQLATICQPNDNQLTTKCQPTVNHMGIPSIDKNRLDKNSIDKNIYTQKKTKEKHKYGEYQHVLLTDDQYEKLKNDYLNAEDLIRYLDEYIEMKGYKAKNHYLAIKKWVVEAVSKKPATQSREDKTPTYEEIKVMESAKIDW